MEVSVAGSFSADDDNGEGEEGVSVDGEEGESSMRGGGG